MCDTAHSWSGKQQLDTIETVQNFCVCSVEDFVSPQIKKKNFPQDGGRSRYNRRQSQTEEVHRTLTVHT